MIDMIQSETFKDWLFHLKDKQARLALPNIGALDL